MDSCLAMSEHINTVCKSAWKALRKIGKIRKYLSKNDCEKLNLFMLSLHQSWTVAKASFMVFTLRNWINYSVSRMLQQGLLVEVKNMNI
jgi:hypothetical protein